MKNITVFGDGYMDETVDMYYFLENDFTNPKFLGNVFPYIGRNPIEIFYEYRIMGMNKESDFGFLQLLNQFMESYNIFNIIPLTEYTILFEYKVGKEKFIGYCGLNGRYNNYISYLIDGINKIDLSSIDLLEIENFKNSNENRVYKTDFIDLDTDNGWFYIINDDVTNYLFHLLPKYLPSNVNLDLKIMKIIKDDTDDISVGFMKLLREKSNQYMESFEKSQNSKSYKDKKVS